MHVSTLCDWFSSSAFSCDSNSLAFRLHENSAQNKSSVPFVHFWWTINERKDERDKAKRLKIMIIIKNL